jgi:hypothetical protein
MADRKKIAIIFVVALFMRGFLLWKVADHP